METYIVFRIGNGANQTQTEYAIGEVEASHYGEALSEMRRLFSVECLPGQHLEIRNRNSVPDSTWNELQERYRNGFR